MRSDMNCIIDIKSKVKNVDSFGQASDEWITFNKTYASKEPILGNEYFTAQTTNSKVEVKFRTYFITGVTNDMRIVDSEGTYEILSAINVKSLNRELLMYCKKVD